jgi:hypothetical protein
MIAITALGSVGAVGLYASSAEAVGSCNWDTDTWNTQFSQSCSNGTTTVNGYGWGFNDQGNPYALGANLSSFSNVPQSEWAFASAYSINASSLMSFECHPGDTTADGNSNISYHSDCTEGVRFRLYLGWTRAIPLQGGQQELGVPEGLGAPSER